MSPVQLTEIHEAMRGVELRPEKSGYLATRLRAAFCIPEKAKWEKHIPPPEPPEPPEPKPQRPSPKLAQPSARMDRHIAKVCPPYFATLLRRLRDAQRNGTNL